MKVYKVQNAGDLHHQGIYGRDLDQDLIVEDDNLFFRIAMDCDFSHEPLEPQLAIKLLPEEVASLQLTSFSADKELEEKISDEIALA